MKHPLPRRHFLALTASFAASAPGLLAQAAKPRIPIGFLGATHSHGLEKVRVVMASPEYELVGVCEADVATRQNLGKLGAKLISQAELLDRAQVVAIESAVRDHARHALVALNAGRHVHVEKPPATTMAQMNELVAVARKKKLLLQSGYMWRYHPGFQAIREAMQNRWLGEVFLVRGAIVNSLAGTRRPEWAEFKGGGMFELGSHLVDAVVRLLGRPKTITPFLRKHGDYADDLRDNNLAVLEYERALAVIYNTNLQAAPSPARSFEVLGTAGSAVLQPIEPPELKLDLAKPAGPHQKGTRTIPLKYKRYEADFVELAAAIRGEKNLAADLETEALVQEILLKVCGME